MITEEQIRDAVQTNGIEKFHVHDCSMCGYPCGYVFHDDKVGYDVGCLCTVGGEQIELRDYSDVAEHFNIQTPEACERIWAKFIDQKDHGSEA